jgi:L-fucose isomerase-like protein
MNGPLNSISSSTLNLVSLETGVVFIPLVSALHDPKSAANVVEAYATWLHGSYDARLKPVSDAESMYALDLDHVAGILTLVVTGGTEKLIQAAASFGRPILVLAHESMNSLPAALEALPSLDQEHRPGLVLGRTDGEYEKVSRFVNAAKALTKMRGHRIGLVGGPSPWLTYSLPDREGLVRRFGIKIVDVSMADFDEEYERASKSAVAKLARKARTRAVATAGITPGDFEKSSRAYVALRSLLKKHDLTCVSVRCFDFVGSHQMTGCYALSLLNDEGIVAGCEGDVPAAVAMITLSEVSGNPTFLANPTLISGHKLVLAHCTIASKLVTDYEYQTHFESGIGIALSGALREGERITVARYNREYSLLRAGEGVITRSAAWSDELCRTQAEIKMDGDAEIVRERPLGNHLVITYGEHVKALREIATLAGIGFEEI